jgi:hypothetical protein
MDIEGCDCSEFERRERYIPCESLMAGEISSLKGKLLSPDLIGMDQREYEVIKIEESELQALKLKERNEIEWPRSRNCMMLFVLSLVVAFIKPLAPLGVFGMLFAVAGYLLGTDSSSVPHKIRDIDDNRLARLQNKVGVLEAKIPTENEYKEQLRAAKDFFKTKYDIYLGQRNRPITNVTTYVHSLHSKYKKA